jgi:hypothetical protein
VLDGGRRDLKARFDVAEHIIELRRMVWGSGVAGFRRNRLCETDLHERAVFVYGVSLARRHPLVPFSHHQEAAPSPEVEQDLWVAKCAYHNLTRELLRVKR